MLPFRVPALEEESFTSWLRRAAHRYDTSPRDLLRMAGSRKRIASTRAAREQLRIDPARARRLGLTAHDLARFDRDHTLTTATRTYATMYQGFRIPAPVCTGFCPMCLSDSDPYWRAAWESPLLVTCPRHQVLLTRACPACGNVPFHSPVWVSSTGPAWMCPSKGHHPDDHHPSDHDRRRVLPWCGHDLRTVYARPAPDGGATGQALLSDLAHRPKATSTLAGITTTRRVGFDAALELLDAHLDTTTEPQGAFLTGDADPHAVAVGLGIAAEVLTAPTEQAAISVLDDHGLLGAGGRHVPIAPPSRIRHRARNPLLAALQIRRHAPHLTPGTHLSLRTSNAHPSYPLTDRPDDQRPWLRLPGQPTVDPTPAWVPAHLWPGIVPACLLPGMEAGHPDTGATLALAAAKIGTLTPWAILCLDLGIPTTLVHQVRALTSLPTWPDLHAHLDQLITHLQTSPPPLDYRTRRVIGDDITLLADALTTAADRHATSTDPGVLLRRFWELFTGGHIRYAPASIALPPHGPVHATYRAAATRADTHDTAVFADAYALLRTAGTLPITGPLTWHPDHVRAARVSNGGDDTAAGTLDDEDNEPHPGVRASRRDDHILLYALLTTGDQPGINSSTHHWAADAIRHTEQPGTHALANQHGPTLADLYLHLTAKHPHRRRPPNYLTDRLSRVIPDYEAHKQPTQDPQQSATELGAAQQGTRTSHVKRSAASPLRDPHDASEGQAIV